MPLGTGRRLFQLLSENSILWWSLRQTSTHKNYWSAITAIHKGFPDGSTVTYNSVILAYLLGHFVESAQVVKLPPMWDLPLGSGQFDQTPLYEPMSDITLELFTFKMVFLVQLALG